MTKLTPLERKIVRRAAERVLNERMGYKTSISAIADATWKITRGNSDEYHKIAGPIHSKFRDFYQEYGCPFRGEPHAEQLRTTRVLLLLTFLHFDGVIE